MRTARSGRKAVLPGLILQTLKTAGGPTGTEDDTRNGTPEGDMRVGFTVSKKVGDAVERNRVKRRLRALAEKILPEMAQGGWDYVIIGRRQALKRPFDLLTKDLVAALERTGTRRGSPAIKSGAEKTGQKKKPA